MKKRTKNLLVSLLLVFAVLLELGFTATAAKASEYSDIEGHWAQTELANAVDSGWITGRTATQLQPDAAITRGEFVKAVNAAFGLTRKADISFTDVTEGMSCYDDVRIGVYYGYIGGYGNGKFGPDDYLTREQICTIFERLLPTIDFTASSVLAKYADSGSISAYAREGVGLMTAKSYVVGYPNGTFGPQRSLTRAEAITMLSRVIKNEDIRRGDLSITKDTTLSDYVLVGDVTVAPGVVLNLKNLILLGRLSGYRQNCGPTHWDSNSFVAEFVDTTPSSTGSGTTPVTPVDPTEPTEPDPDIGGPGIGGDNTNGGGTAVKSRAVALTKANSANYVTISNELAKYSAYTVYIKNADAKTYFGDYDYSGSYNIKVAYNDPATGKQIETFNYYNQNGGKYFTVTGQNQASVSINYSLFCYDANKDGVYESGTYTVTVSCSSLYDGDNNRYNYTGTKGTSSFDVILLDDVDVTGNADNITIVGDRVYAYWTDANYTADADGIFDAINSYYYSASRTNNVRFLVQLVTVDNTGTSYESRSYSALGVYNESGFAYADITDLIVNETAGSTQQTNALEVFARVRPIGENDSAGTDGKTDTITAGRWTNLFDGGTDGYLRVYKAATVKNPAFTTGSSGETRLSWDKSASQSTYDSYLADSNYTYDTYKQYTGANVQKNLVYKVDLYRSTSASEPRQELVGTYYTSNNYYDLDDNLIDEFNKYYYTFDVTVVTGVFTHTDGNQVIILYSDPASRTDTSGAVSAVANATAEITANADGTITVVFPWVEGGSSANVESVVIDTIKLGQKTYNFDSAVQGKPNGTFDNSGVTFTINATDAAELTTYLGSGVWMFEISVNSDNPALNASVKQTFTGTFPGTAADLHTVYTDYVTAAYNCKRLANPAVTVDTVSGQISWEPVKDTDGNETVNTTVSYDIYVAMQSNGAAVSWGDPIRVTATTYDLYADTKLNLQAGKVYEVIVVARSSNQQAYKDSLTDAELATLKAQLMTPESDTAKSYPNVSWICKLNAVTGAAIDKTTGNLVITDTRNGSLYPYDGTTYKDHITYRYIVVTSDGTVTAVDASTITPAGTPLLTADEAAAAKTGSNLIYNGGDMTSYIVKVVVLGWDADNNITYVNSDNYQNSTATPVVPDATTGQVPGIANVAIVPEQNGEIRLYFKYDTTVLADQIDKPNVKLTLKFNYGGTNTYGTYTGYTASDDEAYDGYFVITSGNGQNTNNSKLDDLLAANSVLRQENNFNWTIDVPAKTVYNHPSQTTGTATYLGRNTLADAEITVGTVYGSETFNLLTVTAPQQNVTYTLQFTDTELGSTYPAITYTAPFNLLTDPINGKTGTAAIYVTPGKAYSVKITGSDDTKLLLNSEQSISIFKNLAPTAVEYKSTAAANTAEITAPAEIEASTAANYDVQVYADSKAFGTPVATAALATTADLTATLAGRQNVSAVCSLKAWTVAAATTGSSFIVDSEAVASKAAPVSNENDAKGTFRTGSVPAVTDIAGKIVQSGDKLIITAKIDTADPLYGHIKQYVLSLFKQGTTTTTATVYGTEDNGIVTFDVTTVADNAALETGVYNVTIATVSDDAMLYAGNSAAKSDISYTKNNVTGLTVTPGTTDGTAVWTGAATGYTDDTFTYTVRVYQKSGLVTGLTVTGWTGVDLNGDADGIDLKTTDTTVTIPGFTAGTSYKVLVTAQSKYNMEYAAETESIVIYKATAPTQAVLNDEGIVSWTAQTGASSYTATVKGSVSGLENTVADLGAATYSLIDDTTLNVLAQNAQAYSIVITTIGDEADENTDSIFILNSDATAALNIKDGAVNSTKNTTGVAHPGYLPDVTSVSTEITVSGNDRIVSGQLDATYAELISRVNTVSAKLTLGSATISTTDASIQADGSFTLNFKDSAATILDDQGYTLSLTLGTNLTKINSTRTYTSTEKLQHSTAAFNASVAMTNDGSLTATLANSQLDSIAKVELTINNITKTIAKTDMTTGTDSTTYTLDWSSLVTKYQLQAGTKYTAELTVTATANTNLKTTTKTVDFYKLLPASDVAINKAGTVSYTNNNAALADGAYTDTISVAPTVGTVAYASKSGTTYTSAVFTGTIVTQTAATYTASVATAGNTYEGVVYISAAASTTGTDYIGALANPVFTVENTSGISFTYPDYEDASAYQVIVSHTNEKGLLINTAIDSKYVTVSNTGVVTVDFTAYNTDSLFNASGDWNVSVKVMPKDPAIRSASSAVQMTYNVSATALPLGTLSLTYNETDSKLIATYSATTADHAKAQYFLYKMAGTTAAPATDTRIGEFTDYNTSIDIPAAGAQGTYYVYATVKTDYRNVYEASRIDTVTRSVQQLYIEDKADLTAASYTAEKAVLDAEKTLTWFSDAEAFEVKLYDVTASKLLKTYTGDAVLSGMSLKAEIDAVTDDNHVFRADITGRKAAAGGTVYMTAVGQSNTLNNHVVGETNITFSTAVDSGAVKTYVTFTKSTHADHYDVWVGENQVLSDVTITGTNTTYTADISASVAAAGTYTVKVVGQEAGGTASTDSTTTKDLVIGTVSASTQNTDPVSVTLSQNGSALTAKTVQNAATPTTCTWNVPIIPAADSTTSTATAYTYTAAASGYQTENGEVSFVSNTAAIDATLTRYMYVKFAATSDLGAVVTIDTESFMLGTTALTKIADAASPYNGYYKVLEGSEYSYTVGAAGHTSATGAVTPSYTDSLTLTVNVVLPTDGAVSLSDMYIVYNGTKTTLYWTGEDTEASYYVQVGDVKLASAVVPDAVNAAAKETYHADITAYVSTTAAKVTVSAVHKTGSDLNDTSLSDLYVQRLAKPTMTLGLTNYANVSWNAVENADTYKITVSGAGATATYTTTETSYDLSEFIAAHAATTGTVFSATVTAYSSKNDTRTTGANVYTTSETSQTVSTATIYKLAAPTLTLSYADGVYTAAWTQVAHASGYTLGLYKDGSETPVWTGTATTFGSADVTSAINTAKAGSYVLKATVSGAAESTVATDAVSAAMPVYAVTFDTDGNTVLTANFDDTATGYALTGDFSNVAGSEKVFYVPAGTYGYKITADGFSPITGSAVIGADKTIVINLNKLDTVKFVVSDNASVLLNATVKIYASSDTTQAPLFTGTTDATGTATFTALVDTQSYYYVASYDANHQTAQAAFTASAGLTIPVTLNATKYITLSGVKAEYTKTGDKTTLTWTGNSAEGTYKVHIGETVTTAYTAAGNTAYSCDLTSYVSALAPGASLSVWVESVRISGVDLLTSSSKPITVTKLATPVNASIVNKVLGWDDVTGAGYYDVTIKCGTSSVSSASPTASEYDAAADIDACNVTGTYAYTIRAYATDTAAYEEGTLLVPSAVATGSKTITKLSLPAYVNVAYDVESAKFTLNVTNEVANYTKYVIGLYKDGTEAALATFTDTNDPLMTAYDITSAIAAAGEGSYSVKVTAYGDADTIASDVYTYTFNVYKVLFTNTADTSTTVVLDADADHTASTASYAFNGEKAVYMLGGTYYVQAYDNDANTNYTTVAWKTFITSAAADAADGATDHVVNVPVNLQRLYDVDFFVFDSDDHGIELAPVIAFYTDNTYATVLSCDVNALTAGTYYYKATLANYTDYTGTFTIAATATVDPDYTIYMTQAKTPGAKLTDALASAAAGTTIYTSAYAKTPGAAYTVTGNLTVPAGVTLIVDDPITVTGTTDVYGTLNTENDTGAVAGETGRLDVGGNLNVYSGGVFTVGADTTASIVGNLHIFAGGAGAMSSTSVLYYNASTVDSGATFNDGGGTIHGSGSTTHVYGATILSGQVNDQVIVHNGGTCTVQGATFTHNFTVEEGGTLVMKGTLTVTAGNFSTINGTVVVPDGYTAGTTANVIVSKGVKDALADPEFTVTGHTVKLTNAAAYNSWLDNFTVTVATKATSSSSYTEQSFTATKAALAAGLNLENYIENSFRFQITVKANAKLSGVFVLSSGETAGSELLTSNGKLSVPTVTFSYEGGKLYATWAASSNGTETADSYTLSAAKNGVDTISEKSYAAPAKILISSAPAAGDVFDVFVSAYDNTYIFNTDTAEITMGTVTVTAAAGSSVTLTDSYNKTLTGTTVSGQTSDTVTFVAAVGDVYSYSVTKSGLKTVTGTVTATGAVDVTASQKLLAGTIEVYVTDANNTPVNGITVAVINTATGTQVGSTATSQADGYAYLTNIPVGTGYKLTLTGSNYATASYTGVDVTLDAVTKVNATVTKNGSTVTVYVYKYTTDVTTTPVEGATVTIGSKQQVTDSFGKATLTVDRGASYQVYAVKSGWSLMSIGTADCTGAAASVTLYMQEKTVTAPVIVTVRNENGEAVSGKNVMLSGYGTTYAQTQASDSLGFAYFDNVPTGRYTVAIGAEGSYKAYTVTVYVTSESAVSVAANLEYQTYTASLTVVDENGKPVSGSLVTIDGNSYSYDGTNPVEVELSAGKASYTAVASKTGYAIQTTAVVKAAGEYIVTLNKIDDADATVRIFVTDENNAPLTGAMVTLTGTSPAYTKTVYTGSDGYAVFYVEPSDADNYTAKVSMDNYNNGAVVTTAAVKAVSGKAADASVQLAHDTYSVSFNCYFVAEDGALQALSAAQMQQVVITPIYTTKLSNGTYTFLLKYGGGGYSDAQVIVNIDNADQTVNCFFGLRTPQ